MGRFCGTVAYHSNYLVWFEVARTELFREIGHPYSNLEKELGLRLMVVEASCRYMKPAGYDGLLKVNCRLTEIRKSSFAFEYAVKKVKDSTKDFREDTIAEGKTAHVFINSSGKPKPIPEILKEALK